jgi:hypothetical protein
MPKKKTVTPRIRCPVCGRLAWVSMFQRPIYPIEIVAVVWNGGRANKLFAQPMPVDNYELLADAEKEIALRCKLIAERILGSEAKYITQFQQRTQLPETISYPMVIQYGK